MDVNTPTWIVAVTGLALITVLGALQVVALARPRGEWTIENVYGGSPESTEPRAYFAFNQGYAWADALFWAPCRSPGASECCSASAGDSCWP